jgi:hypothetical protein
MTQPAADRTAELRTHVTGTVRLMWAVVRPLSGEPTLRPCASSGTEASSRSGAETLAGMETGVAVRPESATKSEEPRARLRLTDSRRGTQ